MSSMLQEANARINVLQCEVDMLQSQLTAANASVGENVDELDRKVAEISRLTFRLQDAEHEIQRLRERNAELAGVIGKLEVRGSRVWRPACPHYFVRRSYVHVLSSK